MEKVGRIAFDTFRLSVYDSVNNPVFKMSEIEGIFSYPKYMLEDDEVMIIDDDKYVTETGLYNILEQSKTPAARKWRRIINEDIVKLRKEKMYDIIQQFQEWDNRADTIFFDEQTGKIMQSVTVPGGDVDQVEMLI